MSQTRPRICSRTRPAAAPKIAAVIRWPETTAPLGVPEASLDAADRITGGCWASSESCCRWHVHRASPSNGLVIQSPRTIELRSDYRRKFLLADRVVQQPAHAGAPPIRAPCTVNGGVPGIDVTARPKTWARRSGTSEAIPSHPKLHCYLLPAFAPRGVLSRISRSKCMRMWAASADVLASAMARSNATRASSLRSSCIRNAPLTPKK